MDETTCFLLLLAPDFVVNVSGCFTSLCQFPLMEKNKETF